MIDEIVRKQVKFETPIGANKNKPGICKKGDPVWLPDESTDLKFHITVLRHTVVTAGTEPMRPPWKL